MQVAGAASRCRQTPLYSLPASLHCHATVSRLPTSSPGRLRMRPTIPFSSCGSNSGWREWEKEKEVNFQPVVSTFAASSFALFVLGRRASSSGYGEWKGGGWRSRPRPPVPVCCLAAGRWSGRLHPGLLASLAFILCTPAPAAAPGASATILGGK